MVDRSRNSSRVFSRHRHHEPWNKARLHKEAHPHCHPKSRRGRRKKTPKQRSMSCTWALLFLPRSLSLLLQWFVNSFCSGLLILTNPSDRFRMVLRRSLRSCIRRTQKRQFPRSTTQRSGAALAKSSHPSRASRQRRALMPDCMPASITFDYTQLS